MGVSCATSVQCEGLPCDDGDALTFADAWDASGVICSGIPCAGVDCIGAGPCAGVSHVLYDRKAYALVEIGSQCWFKENLAADNYRNGDAIPGGLTDNQWNSTYSGAQTVFGEGTSYVYGSSSDEVANLAEYGRLYNWYAVNDTRGLCPVGFHVPDVDEINVLIDEFGGWPTAGTALKSSMFDSPPWDGSNSSGFSALPGGIRTSGSFSHLGNYGYWWSSYLTGFEASSYILFSNYPDVGTGYYYDVRYGLSVRCVRD